MRMPVGVGRGVAEGGPIVLVAGVRGARRNWCARAARKSIGSTSRRASWLLASRGRQWRWAGRAARSATHAVDGVGAGSGSDC
jgi:hypothetical protein